ncbi:MAG: AAA family ATPase [Dehalococcoidia bacterium]|nr:AAA family ATPase [Dehalococcoidia bacterium]
MTNNIIAISNQKGGVGKTTTAVTIATELALKGNSTLIIDCDPQANTTSSFGIISNENNSIYNILTNNNQMNHVIQKTDIKHLSILPSNKDLLAAEIELVDITNRETILKRQIENVKNQYDYIIIDTPPALGLLTLNCLTASKWVIIPMQVEYFALEGLNNLMHTIKLIKQKVNIEMSILGIILTMFDKRNKLSFEIEEQISQYYGEMLLGRIPRSIRLAEAPSHGLPIQEYDNDSSGAKAYREIVNKMINVIDQKRRGLNG